MKYVGEEHALHLKQTLEENYKVTLEWDGRRYIGTTLDWDYKCQQVHLSMTREYIKMALKQFNGATNGAQSSSHWSLMTSG